MRRRRQRRQFRRRAPAGAASSPSCRSRAGRARCGTISIELLGEDVEFEATGHIKLARSEADMAELERYAEIAREHGLELTLLGANARARRTALARTECRRRLALADGRSGQSACRRTGLCAACAQARRRDPRIRAGASCRRRPARDFETEAEGVTVTSRWLVNAAGAGAGVVATWFGERAPVSPLMPEHGGDRAAAVFHLALDRRLRRRRLRAADPARQRHLRRRARMGRCRTRSGAAEDRGDARRHDARRRYRAGARRRAGDPHLERHGRGDAGPHSGHRLLIDDAARSFTPSAFPGTDFSLARSSVRSSRN